MSDDFYSKLSTRDLEDQVRHLITELRDENNPDHILAGRDTAKLRANLALAQGALRGRPDGDQLLATWQGGRLPAGESTPGIGQPDLPAPETHGPAQSRPSYAVEGVDDPVIGPSSPAPPPPGAERPPAAVMAAAIAIVVVIVAAVSQGVFHFPLGAGKVAAPGTSNSRSEEAQSAIEILKAVSAHEEASNTVFLRRSQVFIGNGQTQTLTGEETDQMNPPATYGFNAAQGGNTFNYVTIGSTTCSGVGTGPLKAFPLPAPLTRDAVDPFRVLSQVTAPQREPDGPGTQGKGIAHTYLKILANLPPPTGLPANLTVKTNTIEVFVDPVSMQSVVEMDKHLVYLDPSGAPTDQTTVLYVIATGAAVNVPGCTPK